MLNILSFIISCVFTDTPLPLVLLITSNSGCSQMANSSRTYLATTPSSTLWLLTLMACWCLEVLITSCLVLFSTYRECLAFEASLEVSIFIGVHIDDTGNYKYLMRNTSIILHIYVFSVADNGTIHMWDWRTGYNFQRIHAAVQPGSLDSESGIFSCVFDHSESRLITAEADKTIKVYKEDDTAVSFIIMFKVSLEFSVGSQSTDHLTTVFFLSDRRKPPSQLETRNP